MAKKKKASKTTKPAKKKPEAEKPETEASEVDDDRSYLGAVADDAESQDLRAITDRIRAMVQKKGG